MLAAVVGNARDQELDIVLLSAQGRPGHPQPDARASTRPRVRVHRDGRRPARQPRAVDRVGAGRRPHRVLRAHREGQDARSSRTSSTGKTEQQHRPERRWTARSRRRSARTARRVAFAGAAGRRQRHLRGRPRDAASSRTSRRTRSRTTRRRSRPTARRSSTRRASAATTSCSSSTSRPAQKKQLTFGTHDDTGAEVLRRPHDRLHVDGDRSEGRRSRRKWRATATSRTSGRWT